MTFPPIRHRIILPVDVDVAFDAFTEEIGQWWPLDAGHSVLGPGSTLAFSGGALVETSSGGEQVRSADVTTWAPAELLGLAWHPGTDPTTATDVEVVFETAPKAGGGRASLVTLEHRGWERTTDPAAVRADYDKGWPAVLELFGNYVVKLDSTDSPDADPKPDAEAGREVDPKPDAEGEELAYLVLRHTAGPAAPVEGPLFADPSFRFHAEFVESLILKGALIAAGPLDLGGQPGAYGMTVLRIPESEIGDYIELARQDKAVVNGLLSVEPVEWSVMMTGAALQ